MDVKEAVTAAKNYIKYIFADEGVANLRLEEVEFDEADKIWNVTLGLLREREVFSNPTATEALLSKLGGTLDREYKIIRIQDNTEKVLSVKNR
jgi:hypothetical protein